MTTWSSVKAEEARVGQGAEDCGRQMVNDVVVAGGGDGVRVIGQGGGDPDQATVLGKCRMWQ